MDYQEYSKRAIAVAGVLSHKDTVAHAALGLSSELAELLEEVELIRVHGAKDDTQTRFKKEIGDLAWYFNQMLNTLEQDFDDLAIAAFYTPIRHLTGKNFIEIADAITNELGICIGHVADHAKRLVLADKPVPVPEMMGTLARFWRALSTLVPLVGVTWEAVFDANIEKLESRYPKGKFSVVGSEAHRVAAANDAPTAPEVA